MAYKWLVDAKDPCKKKRRHMSLLVRTAPLCAQHKLASIRAKISLAKNWRWIIGVEKNCGKIVAEQCSAKREIKIINSDVWSIYQIYWRKCILISMFQRGGGRLGGCKHLFYITSTLKENICYMLWEIWNIAGSATDSENGDYMCLLPGLWYRYADSPIMSGIILG